MLRWHYTALAFAIAGIAWAIYCEWLRGRPSMKRRSTQPLVLLSSCGCGLWQVTGLLIFVWRLRHAWAVALADLLVLSYSLLLVWRSLLRQSE
jgi:hypothetical protein